MSNGKIAGLLTPFVILIAGCQIAGPDEKGPKVGLVIETDRQHYVAGQVISVKIRNTKQPVFVKHCCGRPYIWLDRLEAGGNWRAAYGPAICDALCDGIMMLVSGFVFHQDIPLRAAGIYRLRIVFGEDGSFESVDKVVVSREIRVSTE